jgi:hypothetical protein
MEKEDNIKQRLQQQLMAKHLFWSYANADGVPLNDDLLIEMALVYLDLEDINRLFTIYPYESVKRVWEERVVRQNNRYKELNMLLAALYFGAEAGQQQAMVNSIYERLQW